MNLHRLSILFLSLIVCSFAAQAKSEGWQKFKNIFKHKIRENQVEALEQQTEQNKLQIVEEIKLDDESLIDKDFEVAGEIFVNQQELFDEEEQIFEKEIVVSDDFAEELVPQKNVITNVQVEQSNDYQHIQALIAQLEHMRIEQEQKELSFVEWVKRKRGVIIATTCAVIGGVGAYYGKHYALFNWFKEQVGSLDDFLNPERRYKKESFMKDIVSEKEKSKFIDNFTSHYVDWMKKRIEILEETQKEVLIKLLKEQLENGKLSRKIVLDDHEVASEVLTS